MKAGHYIIVKSGVRNVLARVSSYDPKKEAGRALIESTELNIDFKEEDIIADLRQIPKHGSVYGVSVEPLLEVLGKHSFWGEIQLFVDLDDSQIKALRRGLKETSALLQKKKMPVLPIVTQVRNKKGAMYGEYRYTGGEFDNLTVRPGPDMLDLDYIFTHEYAHGLWYRCMTAKMHLAWLKLYHSTIAITKVDDVETFATDLQTNGDIRSYLKELAEDQIPAFKACLKYVKDVHSLSSKDLQLMLTHQEDIIEYWPTNVETSDKEIRISKYATKNVEEMWAEAFAYHIRGIKLPKSVAPLMEKTLHHLNK